MDGSLFSKIQSLIDIKTKEKNEVISFLKEKTGIEIKEEQIEIKGKKVFLYLDSNQKILFIKNKGDSFIKEKGFTL